jgi:chemotaxis protein methyltransferase CheR
VARRHDPDALLLEAMLLVQQGAPGEAEQACGQLLVRDAFNAGAHYVMALCREQAGDTAAAAEHDQLALHLDPHFAMPRLHLGLLARRAGQREAARRDLQAALHLLAGEDDARLVLFGGGFGRVALLALCESALRDCGGRA